MTITATLFCLGACLCGLAATAGEPVLACNLKAISAADRPRYNELMHKLRNSVQDRRELPDGYAFRIDDKSMAVTEVAEWICMERLCCPFLTFQLEVKGTNAFTELSLRGPSGAKAILEAEFKK